MLVRGRFTGLTIVMMTLLLSMTVITDIELREAIVGIGFSVFLGFAIWVSGPRLRVATVALAVVPFISHWTLQLSPSLALRVVSFASSSIFLTFLTLVILLSVLRHETVTADTIVGAVCAYLLIGLTWGTWYTLLTVVSPDAFSISPTLAAVAGWHEPKTPFTPLAQYYSFTTLTTLGYGDITPVTAGARGMSVVEGMTGQLYLAILIARLVGLHSARSMK
jgi:voltage-gated potassium channel